MKMPYITIEYDCFSKRIVVGFGIYLFGTGRVLWTDKLRNLFKMWNCY